MIPAGSSWSGMKCSTMVWFADRRQVQAAGRLRDRQHAGAPTRDLRHSQRTAGIAILARRARDVGLRSTLGSGQLAAKPNDF